MIRRLLNRWFPPYDENDPINPARGVFWALVVAIFVDAAIVYATWRWL